MAKIFFIGDCHIKINNFQTGLQFLTWLNKTIEEQKPDIVVNLGDFFNDHAVLRSEVMTEFMNHVNAVLQLKIPYVYLLGNHDLYRVGSYKYHALKHLVGKIKDLYIVDAPTELFGMTFVPFQHNGATFPKATLPICIAHQTFLGADYGPIRATDGVNAESIAGCEVIISGHIHTRSLLGSVIYVGSPFSQSAADVDHVKGITLFNTDTYGTIFVSTPLPAWRRLRTVVSINSTIPEIHSSIATKIVGSKDHWVLEFEGPKAEIVGYLNSKEFRKAVSGIDVKIKTEFTDKEKKRVSIEAKSIDHIMAEYIAKVYQGSIDKTKLKEQVQTILNESRLNK